MLSKGTADKMMVTVTTATSISVLNTMLQFAHTIQFGVRVFTVAMTVALLPMTAAFIRS